MFDIEGPIQDPASGQAPTSAVIFLHGYGADGNDLIGLAPFFATALPGAVFHSPHAPEPCEIAPFGRQWFSLGDYDPKQSATFQLLLPHIRAAAYLFDDYIDGVMAHYGLTADRVALVGFSQGTMMALHVALRRKTPLAAVVGFSGALIGSEVLAQEITARPPVKLIHGEEDEVVPFAAMAMAEAALHAVGVSVTTMARPGLAHGIDAEGAVRASHFLAGHLGCSL